MELAAAIERSASRAHFRSSFREPSWAQSGPARARIQRANDHFTCASHVFLAIDNRVSRSTDILVRPQSSVNNEQAKMSARRRNVSCLLLSRRSGFRGSRFCLDAAPGTCIVVFTVNEGLCA